MKSLKSLFGKSGADAPESRVDVQAEVQELISLEHGKDYTPPFMAMHQRHNELHFEEKMRTRNWQILAFALVVICGVQSAGMVKMALESRIKPYLVEVDKLGRYAGAGMAEAVTSRDQRIVRSQLIEFITDARTVTSDGVVQKKWLAQVYALAGPRAQTFLNAYYKTNDPFEIAKTRRVNVEEVSAVPFSDKTWQLSWVEIRRDQDGRQIGGPQTWTAFVDTSFFDVKDEAMAIRNMSGLIVDGINWTQKN